MCVLLSWSNINTHQAASSLYQVAHSGALTVRPTSGGAASVAVNVKTQVEWESRWILPDLDGSVLYKLGIKHKNQMINVTGISPPISLTTLRKMILIVFFWCEQWILNTLITLSVLQVLTNSLNGMSSRWTNDELKQVSGFALAYGSAPDSPNIFLESKGFIRIPTSTPASPSMPGGDVVVLLTSGGRFLLNGTNISPVTGKLANISLEDYSALLLFGLNGKCNFQFFRRDVLNLLLKRFTLWIAVNVNHHLTEIHTPNRIVTFSCSKKVFEN